MHRHTHTHRTRLPTAAAASSPPPPPPPGGPPQLPPPERRRERQRHRRTGRRSPPPTPPRAPSFAPVPARWGGVGPSSSGDGEHSLPSPDRGLPFRTCSRRTGGDKGPLPAPVDARYLPCCPPLPSVWWRRDATSISRWLQTSWQVCYLFTEKRVKNFSNVYE